MTLYRLGLAAQGGSGPVTEPPDDITVNVPYASIPISAWPPTVAINGGTAAAFAGYATVPITAWPPVVSVGGYGSPTEVFGPGTYATLPTLHDGDVWRFESGAIVTAKIDIHNAGAVLHGNGIFRQPNKTAIGYGDTIGVYAPDVTIDGIRFEGGDIQLANHGSARAKFLRTIHVDRSNCGMYLWGSGCDATLIDGFDIKPPRVSYASSIGAQCEYDAPGVIIRNGSHDQSAHPVTGAIGHFGIELIELPGVRVEYVNSKGGECLMSFPRCDDVVVEHCYFDLRGMNQAFSGNPGWGIEFAGSNNCRASYNNVLGDSDHDDQHFVACDFGGDNVQVTYNTLVSVQAVCDGGGLAPIVRFNDLTDVCDVLAFAGSAPGYIDTPNTIH